MKDGRIKKLLLVAAVIGTLLLTGLASICWISRATSNNPTDVAYDYQMALIRRDYERAYAHLSPTLGGYPTDVETFMRDLQQHEELPYWQIDPCVYVESTEITGDEAVVSMRVQYYDPCYTLLYRLLPSLKEGVRNLMFNEFEVRLQREDGEWRILYAGEHFVESWRGSEGP